MEGSRFFADSLSSLGKMFSMSTSSDMADRLTQLSDPQKDMYATSFSISGGLDGKF